MEPGQRFYDYFPLFDDSDEELDKKEERRVLNSQSKSTEEYPHGRSRPRPRVESMPISFCPSTRTAAAEKFQEAPKKVFDEVREQKVRKYQTPGDWEEDEMNEEGPRYTWTEGSLRQRGDAAIERGPDC